MVFDSVLLAIALIGSAAAGIYDLKTTEVPDWLFYIMGGAGVVIAVIGAFTLNSFLVLQNTIIFSLVLFGFGFLMYKTGQWGGADAMLLGLVAFLVPNVPSGFSIQLLFPFPVSFLLNVFVIGAIYMIIYSVIFAYKNKAVVENYFREVKASAKLLSASSIFLFVVLISLTLYLNSVFLLYLDPLQIFRVSVVPVILVLSLLFFYKFAQVIEKFGFRKKIPISKLRVGDMLLSRRELVGITEKELRKIRKSKKKFVWIKEGVRFSPTFFLALLYTLFFGDAILLLSWVI